MPLTAHVDSPDLGAMARSTGKGGLLRIEGIQLAGDTSPRNLLLQRQEVFTPQAQIVIDGRPMSVPATAHFRGEVEGVSGSQAMITIPEKGSVHGFLFTDGRIVALEQKAGRSGEAGVVTREISARKELAPLASAFKCDVPGDRHGLPAQFPSAPQTDPLPAPDSMSPAAEPRTAAAVPAARVVIETDWEYFSRFNDVNAAIGYATDLIAYASSIYEREIGAALAIERINLNTTGPDGDPWIAADGAASALYELQSHYRAAMDLSERSTVHLLSGKNLGGGAAFVGTLCNKEYGYGVTGNIAGDFNIARPGAAWDIIAVSHEIGHSFSSPHTHCYAGIDGVGSPVDGCYGAESGCYGGVASLPGTNALNDGPAAAGAGTIMSYCHLLQGGYSNVSLTFGRAHPFGVAPERVPSRMSAFAAAQARSFPSCFAAQ